jgi:hypothetical protein
MLGTTTRAFEARERTDEPNGNNRCACGRTVKGFDARLDEATCERCARLRADGSDLQADAEHYLDAAGDQLETAATKADEDWLRGAIESLRVDLAKLQGFRTAAEIRDDHADTVDRGDGIETDGGERISTDDLTDEQIERVLNSKGFQKMLAYSKLADGIDVLEAEDEIFESMVNTITKQHTSVGTEASVREVLSLFRAEVSTFTEPLVEDENGMDGGDLEDIHVEEDESR